MVGIERLSGVRIWSIRHIFREQMALMVKKRQDYGPGNINAFGELGVVVRLSDKMERLKHLLFETNAQGESSRGRRRPRTNRSKIRTGTSSTMR
jgi:hypothetical protein